MNMLMLRKSGSLVKLWSKDGLPKVLCAALSFVPDVNSNSPSFQLSWVVEMISFFRKDVNFVAPVLLPLGEVNWF